MRDDYRGRMHVWFKTLLFFVVFNEVQLYRQLKDTTCMELAKPSNQQYRLSCNDSSKYHCLLNGNSTNEFEICKTWKWIPKGNCAYLNTYGWNIDARSCSSSAGLGCPKTLYRSQDTINYAACYSKKNINSTARQVRNTTCLELAKPSNLHFRMSCNNTGTYHCLLDQNYTKEFEICILWKWIPEGKCAYFGMYSGGNIDERNCTSSSHFVCPEKQYRSENTTNYSGCYLRNNPTKGGPLTSPSPDASNLTNSYGNGGNATSSRISETAEKHIEMKAHPLPIILGIIFPLASIAVIYFIFMHFKYVPLYRKSKLTCIFNESQEPSDRVRNNGTIEQEPFLRIGVEGISGILQTMQHENENITEARRNGNPDDSAESNESDLLEHVEDAVSSPTSNKERNFKVSAGNPDDSAESNESDLLEHVEDAVSSPTSNKERNFKVSADAEIEDWDDEKSAKGASNICIISKISNNEEENEEKLTDVFDDPVESLQRIAPPTDAQEKEKEPSPATCSL